MDRPPMDARSMDRKRGNRLIAGACAAAVCGMVGLSFAAIPLYRLFCAATGYGGTPKIGAAVAPGGNGQTIKVDRKSVV